MDVISEKQKTKIFYNSDIDSFDLDCYVKKVFSTRIVVEILKVVSGDFSEIESGLDVDVKIYTPNGIAIFKSKITKIISKKEIEISYSNDDIKVENTRQYPRYEANCPLTIFRPLKGNIEGNLIDISIRGLRFFSETPLDTNSTFEIMLYLSDTVGKIMFSGRVLDKVGLPDGVHRMIIEEISYSDRQKLTDFCMSLAK